MFLKIMIIVNKPTNFMTEKAELDWSIEATRNQETYSHLDAKISMTICRVTVAQESQ